MIVLSGKKNVLVNNEKIILGQSPELSRFSTTFVGNTSRCGTSFTAIIGDDTVFC